MHPLLTFLDFLLIFFIFLYCQIFLHVFFALFEFLLQIGFLFNFTYFTYFVFYRLYILYIIYYTYIIHIISDMIIATKFVIIIELSKYLHQNQILNILFNNITYHFQMGPYVLYVFYIVYFTYCISYILFILHVYFTYCIFYILHFCILQFHFHMMMTATKTS